MAQPISEHFHTDFCLQLANHVLEAQISQASNFVASPLSLHIMLSLAASGSKGDTLQQFLQFLGSKDVADLNSLASQIMGLTSADQEGSNGGPILSFANGAWIDCKFSLNPSFEAMAKGSYKAEIRNVDFQAKPGEAVEQVNSWAEKETRGLIKTLLSNDAVHSETVLILANALYFKGSWDRKFDTSRTQSRDFHLLSGETVQAPFMTTHSSIRRHSYQCSDGFKVLQVPYQSAQQDRRRFSMYFLLPDKRDGLLSLVQKMKSSPAMLNQKFQLEEEKLTQLWIPKFKFSFGFEASDTMKKLGLQLLFNPGELTEIVDCPDGSNSLFVSSIFHKALIEVNEEGTEAAACTASFFELTSFRQYPSFVADHPFLFMIREETHNVVFFVGAVLNPLLD